MDPSDYDSESQGDSDSDASGEESEDNPDFFKKMDQQDNESSEEDMLE